MTNLSPEIEAVKYERSSDKEIGEINVIEYTNWELDVSESDKNPQTTVVDSDMVRHITRMGDVYIGDGHAHVPTVMYDSYPMVVLREYVANCISELNDDGIVVNIERKT